MTRLLAFRHLRIAAFALGATAVAGAAVLVTASAAGLTAGFRSSTPQANAAAAASITSRTAPAALCNAFIAHLSTDLGKTPAQVDAAIRSAFAQTLADQVKAGKLTQAQATAIQKRLAGWPPCSLAGLGRPAAGSTIYSRLLVSAAASALGVSDAQLKADLARGMTLSQVAAAQTPAVTEAQFRTRLIARLKPLLDTAVKNGKLTSAHETAILNRLQTGPIPLWSTPRPRTLTPAPASPTTT
jgi:hypothetical protein